MPPLWHSEELRGPLGERSQPGVFFTQNHCAEESPLAPQGSSKGVLRDPWEEGTMGCVGLLEKEERRRKKE
ncbi:MAG: hypothetical protein CO167_13775 [Candidatus Marinimicrobia bacterium CG_4_9_14_3_um_filter_48_9]|nr:MAG: hypothetical protein CO167_13775 [Candidatus Marinimicrobia bacterium CG_4_9_14_3_um_filter_48_9]